MILVWSVRESMCWKRFFLMTIVAVLSGAGSWNEIEDYGKAKRLWLKGFLKLPGGIPSRDTFNRVISGIKQDKTCKLDIKGKRLKAGWDNDYLLNLLGI